MKKNHGLIEGLLDGKDEKESKGKEKEHAHKGKKSKHRVHTMHIKRAHGGYIVQHENDAKPEDAAMSAEENQPHVMPDMASLQQHVAENMPEEPQEGGGLAAAQPTPQMPA